MEILFTDECFLQSCFLNCFSKCCSLIQLSFHKCLNFPNKSLRCSKCSINITFLKRSLPVPSDLPQSPAPASNAWYSATEFFLRCHPGHPLHIFPLYRISCFLYQVSSSFRVSYLVLVKQNLLSWEVHSRYSFWNFACLKISFFLPDTWGLMGGLDKHRILGSK